MLLMAAVEFELVFGLWLLVGFCPRGTRRVALACFGVFALVSAGKALAGEDSCGCFGLVVVNPWYSAVLDAGAIVALVFAGPGLRGQKSRTLFSRAEFTVFAGLLVVPSAVLMGRFTPATLHGDGAIGGEGAVVLLEPESCVGRRLPLVSYVDIGSKLVAGNWTVVLYRHDCPKCHALIDRLAQQARSKLAGRDPVALIEVPPFASDDSQFRISGFSYGRLSDTYDWFVTTPVLMRLRNGTVVTCRHSRDASFSRKL
jgi:hypothetical protein